MPKLNFVQINYLKIGKKERKKTKKEKKGKEE